MKSALQKQLVTHGMRVQFIVVKKSWAKRKLVELYPWSGIKGKERGRELAFSFLHILRPQPMRWCGPHSECVFWPQLNLSGNKHSYDGPKSSKIDSDVSHHTGDLCKHAGSFEELVTKTARVLINQKHGPEVSWACDFIDSSLRRLFPKLLDISSHPCLHCAFNSLVFQCSGSILVIISVTSYSGEMAKVQRWFICYNQKGQLS